jgi:predicted PurR-regulated permease PerM
MIGIGIGILLAPVLTSWQHRFHLPRSISALMFLLLSVLGLAGIGWILGYLATDQFTRLSQSAPQLIENAKAELARLSETYPWLEAQVQGLNVNDAFTSAFDQLFSGVKSGIFALSSLAIAIFLGLYTAVDSEEYFESLLLAFSPERRARAREVLQKCASVLRIWFRAQLVDMGIIGLSMGLVLKIVGMEYWAVFALLTAILCIIPYAGILIVIVLAGLVTLGSQPGKVPIVITAIFVVQQLEANVVLPRVMRDKAQLPEVPLLIFMLLMGSWFGIVGVFVAPALFAVLKTFYNELYQPWLNARELTNLKVNVAKSPEQSVSHLSKN